MAYGNSYTDKHGRPWVSGEVTGKNGKGGPLPKEFLVDTAANISGVDAANIKALKDAGAAIKNAGGTVKGSAGGTNKPVKGVTMAFDVFDPGTGLTTKKTCDLPVARTPPGYNILGTDQMKHVGCTLPFDGYIPDYRYSAKHNIFTGGLVKEHDA